MFVGIAFLIGSVGLAINVQAGLSGVWPRNELGAFNRLHGPDRVEGHLNGIQVARLEAGNPGRLFRNSPQGQFLEVGGLPPVVLDSLKPPEFAAGEFFDLPWTRHGDFLAGYFGG